MYVCVRERERGAWLAGRQTWKEFRSVLPLGDLLPALAAVAVATPPRRPV